MPVKVSAHVLWVAYQFKREENTTVRRATKPVVNVSGDSLTCISKTNVRVAAPQCAEPQRLAPKNENTLSKRMCIVCGMPAEFRKNLMDIKQSMVVQGIYCRDHAIEQCDAEKNVITRFCLVQEKNL